MTRRGLLVLFAGICAFAQESDYVNLTSPDGRIEFRLFNADPDTPSMWLRLAYTVRFRGKLLIDTSSLGYDIEEQVPLGEKLAVSSLSRETVDETYTLVTGKASRVRNRYNALSVNLLQEGTQGRWVVMEVRAYDDGVAFRYYIPPSAPLDEARIENERTQFQLARDATVYAQTPVDFHGDYEDEYHRYTLTGIHEGAPIALPLLAEQPGVGWVGIAEANIDDYPGLYLQRVEDRILRARLAPRLDGSGLAALRKTPFTSPWRVILIADTPAELAASNLLTSLNEPNAIGDTSWIGPAPASAWETADFVDVEANYEKTFPEYAARGMRGVVVENIRREDQTVSVTLRRIAAKAAEHRLMLILRDVSKPDGSERTYPNVIAREAAITNDYAQWGARANPDHNVLLAFTRLLAGPVEYKPGAPSTTREEFVPGQGVLGTEAHQRALAVIFNSPEGLPAAWDETRAVGGDPESYFAIARRKGDDWWLAVINNGTARTVDLPVGFLAGGLFTREVQSDGPIEQPAKDVIRAALAPGGGLVIHFKK